MQKRFLNTHLLVCTNYRIAFLFSGWSIGPWIFEVNFWRIDRLRDSHISLNHRQMEENVQFGCSLRKCIDFNTFEAFKKPKYLQYFSMRTMDDLIQINTEIYVHVSCIFSQCFYLCSTTAKVVKTRLSPFWAHIQCAWNSMNYIMVLDKHCYLATHQRNGDWFYNAYFKIHCIFLLLTQIFVKRCLQNLVDLQILKAKERERAELKF